MKNKLAITFFLLILISTAKAQIQSDTSDAVWSIVMPQSASRDIDMKQCLLGSAKDSMIADFISNTGTYKFRVDSIYFTGADASVFSVVSGFPKYEVAAGKSKACEFRFVPNRIGIHNSTINIITQAETLIQTIIGEGVEKKLKILTDIVDFGKVYVGTSKDTICTLIKNISSNTVYISNVMLLGPDTSHFKILQGLGSFPLAPDEEKELKLQFSPKYFGRTCCDVGFFYNDVGSPARAQLFGEGVGIPTLIRIPDTTAKIGTDNYKIPIYAKFLYDTSMTGLSFKAEIRIDAFAFLPYGNYITSEIINNERVINISGSINSLSTDEQTLTEIEG